MRLNSPEIINLEAVENQDHPEEFGKSDNEKEDNQEMNMEDSRRTIEPSLSFEMK